MEGIVIDTNVFVAAGDGDGVILLPRLIEAGGMVCQVICQLMGTVFVGWRF